MFSRLEYSSNSDSAAVSLEHRLRRCQAVGADETTSSLPSETAVGAATTAEPAQAVCSKAGHCTTDLLGSAADDALRCASPTCPPQHLTMADAVDSTQHQSGASTVHSARSSSTDTECTGEIPDTVVDSRYQQQYDAAQLSQSAEAAQEDTSGAAVTHELLPLVSLPGNTDDLSAVGSRQGKIDDFADASQHASPGAGLSAAPWRQAC